MTENSIETQGPPNRPTPWRIPGKALVPLLLVLAFAAWEITSDPALSALILCFKQAQAEVATGWWLWRYDPDRSRGRVCFWFHLGWGLWKTALGATLLVLGGVVAAVFLARFGRAPLMGFLAPLLRGALLTAGAGYGLSLLVTYIALIAAWWHGVRVWLGNAQHLARQEGFWPPRVKEFNKAPTMGLAALVITLFAGIFTMVGVFFTMDMPPGMANQAGGLWPVILNGIFLVAGVIGYSALVIFLFQAADRKFAMKIEDCWPDLPGEAASVAPSP